MSVTQEERKALLTQNSKENLIAQLFAQEENTEKYIARMLFLEKVLGEIGGFMYGLEKHMKCEPDPVLPKSVTLTFH